MRSRSFSLYTAVHSLIVTLMLAVAVIAQAGWRLAPTPGEIVEENNATGDLAVFENHTDGSTRFTRTTFFPGTSIPQTGRVVITSNGTTTIFTVVSNDQGQTISETKEVISGALSYEEAKNDLNWQDRRIDGSRWYYRQDANGNPTGQKIEEFFSPASQQWNTTQKNPSRTTVRIFHHPSRLNDARRAKRSLDAVYQVTLHQYKAVNVNVEAQRNSTRKIYYYPERLRVDAESISAALRYVEPLDVSGPEAAAEGGEPFIAFYLIDNNLREDPPGTGDTVPTVEPMIEVPVENRPATRPGPPNIDGRDKIIESLERNYGGAKRQVDRPGYDDNEARRLLNEMEGILAFAEAQIAKEIQNGEANGERRARLDAIKKMAEADILMLKARLGKPKTGTLAGTWRLLINGEPQPGRLTFDESGPTAALKKDSKLWLLILFPKSADRRVTVPAEAQIRFAFGRQLVQLRGEAASGRLEFWATQDLVDPELRKTKYALVREEEERSRRER